MEAIQFGQTREGARRDPRDFIVIEPQVQQLGIYIREGFRFDRRDIVVAQVEPRQAWRTGERVLRYRVDLVEDQRQRLQLSQFREQVPRQRHHVAVQVEPLQVGQTAEGFPLQHGYPIALVQVQVRRRHVLEGVLSDRQEVQVAEVQSVLETALRNFDEHPLVVADVESVDVSAGRLLHLRRDRRREEQESDLPKERPRHRDSPAE